MKRMIAPALLLTVVMVACSPTAAPPTPTTAPTSIPPTIESVPTSEPSALEEVVRAQAERPTWQTVTLTNAASGNSFTLADFPEKTVFVELIATWCSNCRAQQGQVRAAREQLGEDNYTFISLSVEPNDTTSGLGEYAVSENFPWIFATAPTEMVQALVEQFGRTVTNPPSTPHFVISPSGAISQLMTGMHSAEQLVAELSAAAGA